jgi:peptidoglycan hydrolase CwlO-like protein
LDKIPGGLSAGVEGHETRQAMKESIGIIITAMGGIITAIITYYLGKKKQTVEIQNTELDNVDKAVKIWRQLAQDMQRDMENWKSLAIKLQGELDELKNEVHKLQEENGRLTIELNRLSKLINLRQ